MATEMAMVMVATEKELRVGGSWGATSALKTGSGVIDELLYPGEAPLRPTQVLESVAVGYPPMHMELFGWRIECYPKVEQIE